jgi:hypothetical protein
MAVIRVLFILLLAGGCATAPLERRHPGCEDSCRAALDLRDKTMKKFERLCIALTYVGARHFDDKNIQQEVREGVMVCDYVYGNKDHG